MNSGLLIRAHCRFSAPLFRSGAERFQRRVHSGPPGFRETRRQDKASRTSARSSWRIFQQLLDRGVPPFAATRSVTIRDCISSIACSDDCGVFFGMSSRLLWPNTRRKLFTSVAGLARLGHLHHHAVLVIRSGAVAGLGRRQHDGIVQFRRADSMRTYLRA